jgi:hypothetical protein
MHWLQSKVGKTLGILLDEMDLEAALGHPEARGDPGDPAPDDQDLPDDVHALGLEGH